MCDFQYMHQRIVSGMWMLGLFYEEVNKQSHQEDVCNSSVFVDTLVLLMSIHMGCMKRRSPMTEEKETINRSPRMSQAVNHRIPAEKGTLLATSSSSYLYNFLMVVLKLLTHFRPKKELALSCDSLQHIERNKTETRSTSLEVLPIIRQSGICRYPRYFNVEASIFVCIYNIYLIVFLELLRCDR